LAKNNVAARDTLAAEARELTLFFHQSSQRAADGVVLFGFGD
jgi:hypothetical protein